MLIISATRAAANLFCLSLFPESDKRRQLSNRELKLTEKAILGSKAAGTAGFIPSSVSAGGVESEFIALHYEDCVTHIKDYQKEHWVVASWIFAGQIAVTYGLTAVASFSGNKTFLNFWLFLVPIFIGLFGLVLLNELSVALERNRKHLDTLRILMGGLVAEIYLDCDFDKLVINSRHDNKRQLELVTHLAVILLAVFCASYVGFHHYSVQAERSISLFQISW